MKAQIVDQEALSLIRPLEVAAYLRNDGWRQIASRGDISSSWAKDSGQDHFEVDLPMRHDLRDFSRRVRDILAELEEVEQRSQLDIYTDLMTVSSDRLRIRTLAREAESGTLPLDASVSYIESARDVILAAACSTVTPRANYPTRKPTEATDYLKRVRLGQTERGSFVLTVLCPVPPEMHNPVQLLVRDPFERRVTKTLMSSLSAARIASQQAVVTGSFDGFLEAVHAGVSANLCDALVRIGESIPESSLDISLAWAKNRPIENGLPDRTIFEPEFIPVLKEASRHFRNNEPEEDIQLIGYVTQLKRGEDETLGQATVTGLSGDEMRRAVIVLGEDDFALATRAIEERRPISCKGDLVRSGRSFQLTNPHDFKLLDTEVDERNEGFDFSFGE